MGSVGDLRLHRDRALQESSSALQCFPSCFSCPPQEQGRALSDAGAGSPKEGWSWGRPAGLGGCTRIFIRAVVCVPCSQYVPVVVLFILQSRLKIQLNYLGNSITSAVSVVIRED